VPLGGGFTTIPIGKVRRERSSTVAEMYEAGLTYVCRRSGKPIFRRLLHLPRRQWGTPARTTAAWGGQCACRYARPDFPHSRAGNSLALPEVPMAARRALLKLASRHGFLKVASYTSGEIREAVETGDLRDVDLLAVNLVRRLPPRGIHRG
jgi:hypothetical protein